MSAITHFTEWARFQRLYHQAMARGMRDGDARTYALGSALTWDRHDDPDWVPELAWWIRYELEVLHTLHHKSVAEWRDALEQHVGRRSTLMPEDQHEFTV